LSIVERVRRIFDLAADPSVIEEHLCVDPLLRGPLREYPGIRTPGAWDGFELAVRAIVGQQISVRAATTLAGRIASLWGSAFEGDSGIERIFPTPAQLAGAELERTGVMPARAETIRALARAMDSGAIALDARADGRAAVAALRALPGIGVWTAEYIAMRALGEPDAFPSGDLVLRRVAGNLSARALDRRSEAWRPWRAYAVMLLWQSAGSAASSGRKNDAQSIGTSHARSRHASRVSARGRTRPQSGVDEAR
jgi:AraC family transcriptional regulator of adaptative response / DNA-3-methyladenine glycosylase II